MLGGRRVGRMNKGERWGGLVVVWGWFVCVKIRIVCVVWRSFDPVCICAAVATLCFPTPYISYFVCSQKGKRRHVVGCPKKLPVAKITPTRAQ